MPKFASLLLLLVAAPAFAGETRVGVIDFNKIYTDTATAKQDRAELDQMLHKQQQAVDAERAKVARMQTELTANRDKLNPGDRARREAEVDLESAALRKLFDEAEKAVNARERELSGRVLADAKTLAPEVAKQHNLSLVLAATEAILFAAPSVVQVDLTGEVAQAIDRLHARQSSVLRRPE